jgi:NAD(P)-dependent dehydrogenase (short-subunit alcohol dehydrogenase family)
MSVFITGGGGGLGAAIAHGFAARGIAVGVVDIAEDSARRVAEEVSARWDVPSAAVACDLQDWDSISAAWTAVGEQLGPILQVVNNAGVFSPKPDLRDLTQADWRFAVAVNLDAPFFVSQTAAREWIDAGTPGTIVNVASTAAFTVAADFHAVDYGASKAGLVGLTHHLGVDLGPHGIRVNAIAPSSFRSPMNAERLKDPAELAKSERMTPLHRVAEASEMADAVVFLALDATYVNGQVLAVDGGQMLMM